MGQPADEANKVGGREEPLEIAVGGSRALVLRLQVIEVGRSESPSLGSDVLQWIISNEAVQKGLS